MSALAATSWQWEAFNQGASSVIAAAVLLIFAPAASSLLVTRLADSAFMRRILDEDDR